MDGVARAAFYVLYRMALVYWFVCRPTERGAAVLVRHGGRLLVVRHSYKRRLGVPAGRLRRGEEPRAAAARELREEVGVRAAPEDLVELGLVEDHHEFKTSRTRFYLLELDAPPEVRVDGREIVEAWFAAPEALDAEDLWVPLRLHLAGRTTDRPTPPRS